MKEKNLTKLEKIIETLDENLTKEDFVKSFEQIIQLVLKIEKRNSEVVDMIEKTYANLVKRAQDDHTSAYTDLTGKVNHVFVGERLAEMKKLIDDRIAKIKDGKDGKDSSVPGPKGLQGYPGKDGSPDTPGEVRDKLERLPSGEKLSIQAIQDLSKIIEELKNRPVGTVGGLISRRIRFIDDETPTGTVNGTNKIFTVSKFPESGSLKVYRSGARQRVTEDYTLSGRTITFTVAPVVGEILLADFRW